MPSHQTKSIYTFALKQKDGHSLMMATAKNIVDDECGVHRVDKLLFVTLLSTSYGYM